MSLQGDNFRFKLLAVWKPHLQVDHHFDSPAMLFYYYHPLVSHLDSCASSAVTSTRKPKWILKSRNRSTEFVCITLSHGSLCLQPPRFSDKTFPCLAFFPELLSSLLLCGFSSCRPMCARFPNTAMKVLFPWCHMWHSNCTTERGACLPGTSIGLWQRFSVKITWPQIHLNNCPQVLSSLFEIPWQDSTQMNSVSRTNIEMCKLEHPKPFVWPLCLLLTSSGS